MGEQVTESARTRAETIPVGPQRSVKHGGVLANPSAKVRPVPAARPPYGLMAVILLLTVALAATWSLVAQRELATAITRTRTDLLELARVDYEAARARTQAALQAQCQILAEDPRLKATLATENMNAETVDDILADLSKLSGGGVFLVLTPEGRVFAESGAKELRGLDLSASSVVKRAQGQTIAAVGAWVLGGRAMDLSIMALRYGEDLIAYLVVGQAISDADLKLLATQCGCDVATSLGGKVDAVSTSDAALRAALERLAADASPSRARVVRVGNADYAASSFELGDVTQSHRLVVASALSPGRTPFSRLAWLMWGPPALMLVAVLFAFSAHRSSRRPS
jgi:sigma-B regulation protein RsbU (phosphoserine phosphatase)